MKKLNFTFELFFCQMIAIGIVNFFLKIYEKVILLLFYIQNVFETLNNYFILGISI